MRAKLIVEFKRKLIIVEKFPSFGGRRVVFRFGAAFKKNLAAISTSQEAPLGRQAQLILSFLKDFNGECLVSSIHSSGFTSNQDHKLWRTDPDWYIWWGGEQLHMIKQSQLKAQKSATGDRINASCTPAYWYWARRDNSI